MSRYIEVLIFVSGSQEDKDTFLSDLGTAANSDGWIVDGSTYTKNVSYATSVSGVVNGLYALVDTAFISGLSLSVTENTNTLNWS